MRATIFVLCLCFALLAEAHKYPYFMRNKRKAMRASNDYTVGFFDQVSLLFFFVGRHDSGVANSVLDALTLWPFPPLSPNPNKHSFLLSTFS